MLIPIRCFSCGKVIADKWRRYQAKLQEHLESAGDSTDKDEIDDPAVGLVDPAVGLIGPSAAKVLNEMKITKMCCRRHFLSNVDAMHRI